MLFYKAIPKEYSGGIVGLNIFFGSLGMLLISKTSAVMYNNVSVQSVYGFGAILTLLYLVGYLLYIYASERGKSVSLLREVAVKG